MGNSWSLAWHFARCEIRGSVARFRVFLAALMLGVAAIGAVGSVAEAMRAGIDNNARSLLGGDFELSSLHIPPAENLLSLPARWGRDPILYKCARCWGENRHKTNQLPAS